MVKDRGQAGDWDSVAALAGRNWPGRERRVKRDKKEKSAKAGAAPGEAAEAEDMAGEDATCFTRRV